MNEMLDSNHMYTVYASIRVANAHLIPLTSDLSLPWAFGGQGFLESQPVIFGMPQWAFVMFICGIPPCLLGCLCVSIWDRVEYVPTPSSRAATKPDCQISEK